MDAETLIDLAVKEVDDQSLEDDFDLLAIANRCVNDVAAGGPGLFVDRPLLAPLPNLYKIGSMVTVASQFVADLPADYMRKLVLIADSTGRQVNFYESFSEFNSRFLALNDTGDVKACSIKGSKLYYQGAPATPATLTVHYHRLPVEMGMSDEPDGIPAAFHKKVVVPYICKELWEHIEDELEGPGRNTAKYTKLYYSALQDLSAFIGPEDGVVCTIRDETDYSIG